MFSQFRYVSIKDREFKKIQDTLNKKLPPNLSFYIDGSEVGYKDQKAGKGKSGAVSSFYTSESSYKTIKKVEYSILAKTQQVSEETILKSLENEAKINKLIYGVGELYINSEEKIAYLKMKKLPLSFNENYSDKPFSSVNEILNIYINLLLTTLHLHKKGVAHGDMHFGNICVDEEGQVFLCDFGSAIHVDSGENKEIFIAKKREDIFILGNILKILVNEPFKSQFMSLEKDASELNELDALADEITKPDSEITIEKILEKCNIIYRKYDPEAKDALLFTPSKLEEKHPLTEAKFSYLRQLYNKHVADYLKNPKIKQNRKNIINYINTLFMELSSTDIMIGCLLSKAKTAQIEHQKQLFKKSVDSKLAVILKKIVAEFSPDAEKNASFYLEKYEDYIRLKALSPKRG